MASGMRGNLIKRLFTSVGLTKMLYAADVWCTPTPNKRPGTRAKTKTHVKRMERVQRKLAIRITGALRTTPSDLLFPHAGLSPLQLHVEKVCQNSAVRIATLPKHHPLHKAAQKAATRLPKKHPSPLQIILHSLPFLPSEIETIDTIKKPPNWTPPVETYVSASDEEAIERENTCEDEVKIYTDGSGQNGYIGAAAVLTRGFHPFQTARYHLGPDTEHTVYEGECIGQLLGIHLLNQLRPNLNINSASIAVDNQASILVHNTRKPGPGSHIIDSIHRLLQTTSRVHPNAVIKTRWIPGHRDILGSDRADEEAKKASEGPHRNRNSEFGLLRKRVPASKSAVKQLLRTRLKKREARLFRESHRFNKISQIDPYMPDTKFPRETARLDRRYTSILTQLWTAHVPLQSYLHRFKIEPQPTCPHCHLEPETVTHYLKYCSAFREPRKELQRNLGRLTVIDLSILGNHKHRNALLRYIHRTGRFTESHGSLKPPDPNANQEQNNNPEAPQPPCPTPLPPLPPPLSPLSPSLPPPLLLTLILYCTLLLFFLLSSPLSSLTFSFFPFDSYVRYDAICALTLTLTYHPKLIGVAPRSSATRHLRRPSQSTQQTYEHSRHMDRQLERRSIMSDI